jgi:hypothetical protein
VTEFEKLLASYDKLLADSERAIDNLEGQLKKKRAQLSEKDSEIDAWRRRTGVYRSACAALLSGHAVGGDVFEEALEGIRQVVNEQA